MNSILFAPIKVIELINLTGRKIEEYRKGRGEDIHDKMD